MLTQTELPLVSDNLIITYSNLKEVLKKSYIQKGPPLIQEVNKLINEYEISKSKIEMIQTLKKLNQKSLLLSIYDEIWNEFSLVIFNILLTCKNNINFKTKKIKDLFLNTLTKIESNKHDRPK